MFYLKKLNVFRTDSEELGNKNCAPAAASSGPAAMPSISGGSRSATLPRNRSADSHSLRTDSDGAESTMERSLALLTAQYEKNNRNSLNSQVSRRLLLSGTLQLAHKDFFSELWNRNYFFTVPVPTFEKLRFRVPTFGKLRFRFRFQLYGYLGHKKLFKKNFGKKLGTFLHSKLFARKTFISFIKVMVICERKKC